MAWLLIGLLLALAAFFLYSAKTPDGMDWKRGLFAVAALGAAVWAWVTGLFQSAPPVYGTMRHLLAVAALVAAFVFLAKSVWAHDEYTGMRDPVTGGLAASTARGDGYGDCSVLELAPGVLTPVPEGYIVRLTKDQAVKINPRAIRGVEVFVPRERIQPAKFNEYRMCMGPTGTLYCFFETWRNVTVPNEIVYRQRRRDKFGKVKLTSEIVRRIPTQAELKSLMHYDPETGVFTHLRTAGKAKAGARVGKPNWQGYVEMRVMNTLFKAHQLVWLYMTGSLPPAPLTPDHINGVRSDNRWCNLRLADHHQQTWNSTHHHHNKSGLKGAWPCKTTGRWQSLLNDGENRISLGRFDTAQEAHAAWVKKATEIRGSEWVARASGGTAA